MKYVQLHSAAELYYGGELFFFSLVGFPSRLVALLPLPFWYGWRVNELLFRLYSYHLYSIVLFI